MDGVLESGIGKMMVGPLAGLLCGRALACFRGPLFFFFSFFGKPVGPVQSSPVTSSDPRSVSTRGLSDR